METKQQALTLSPQQLQVAGLASFRAIEAKARELEESSIGSTPNELLPYCKTPEAANAVIAFYDDHKLTVEKAFFGMNIQKARRLYPEQLFTLVQSLFKRTLLFINKDHPWIARDRADLELKEMLQYGLTWTVEDFVVFFDKLRRNELARHFDKPDSEWLRDSLVAYANLIEDFREDFRKRLKDKAMAEQADFFDAIMPPDDAPFILPSEYDEYNRKHRPRTAAEFQGGKDYLNAFQRALLAQRDKKRRDEEG